MTEKQDNARLGAFINKMWKSFINCLAYLNRLTAYVFVGCLILIVGLVIIGGILIVLTWPMVFLYKDYGLVKALIANFVYLFAAKAGHTALNLLEEWDRN